MKKRSDKPRLHGVTLGQVFQDTWHYGDGDKTGQDLLAAAAVRYTLTGEEPTRDERARIGSGWGGVKCEIDRIPNPPATATDAVANAEGDREAEGEPEPEKEPDGKGESEGGAGGTPAAPDSPSRSRSKKSPYTLDREEVWAYFRADPELVANSDRFVDWWNAGGWRCAANPTDWQSSARNWAAHEWDKNPELKNPATRNACRVRIRDYYNDPLRWTRYVIRHELAKGKWTPEKLRRFAVEYLAARGFSPEEAEAEVSNLLECSTATNEPQPEVSYPQGWQDIPKSTVVEAAARWCVPDSAEERYAGEVTEISEAADPPRPDVVDGYPVISSPEERWGKRHAAGREPEMKETAPKSHADPATPEPSKNLSRGGRDKSRDKSHAVRDKSRAARDKNDHATPRAKGKATRRPSGRRSAAGGKKEKR